MIISRIATVLVLLAALILAWAFVDRNIVLLVWIGIGGMMAALAGPLVLGVLWSGVTKQGAIAGFITGAVVFAVLKTGVVRGDWFSVSWLKALMLWLENQQHNPYSCATFGEIASVAITVIVSVCTPKLSSTHLKRIFGEQVSRN